MRERLTWLVDRPDSTQCPPSSTPAQCFDVSRNQFLLTLITTANDKKTRFYHASCVPRVFLLWHDTKRSTSRWNAWAVPMLEGFSAWFHRLWTKMPGSVWGNQWISPNDRFYCPLTIIWRFIFSASTVTPPTQRALVTKCKAIMVAFEWLGWDNVT